MTTPDPIKAVQAMVGCHHVWHEFGDPDYLCAGCGDMRHSGQTMDHSAPDCATTDGVLRAYWKYAEHSIFADESRVLGAAILGVIQKGGSEHEVCTAICTLILEALDK